MKCAWVCSETSPTVVASLYEGNELRGGVPGCHLVCVLDGDKWKPRKTYRQRQGGNGFGINADGASYTLNNVDRHIVAILERNKQ